MQSKTKKLPINKRFFSKFDQNLFDTLEVQGTDLYLNGSYRHPIFSLYSADVDLYQPIKYTKKGRRELRKHIRDLMTQLKTSKEIHFLELKINDTKYKTIDSAMNNAKRIKTGIKKVKLDTWVFNQGFCEEVSIIYDFRSPITSQQFIEDVQADIKKFVGKDMYYKALKRKQILMKALKHENELNRLNKILLKTDNAFLYLTIQRLRTLLLIQNSFIEKDKALDNTKDSIRRLGLMTDKIADLFSGQVTNVRINKLIKVLQKILNYQIEDEI